MTAVDAGAGSGAAAHAAEAEAPAVTGPLGGNPALLGLPTFIAGATALGLYLIGYVPVGAPIAVILLSAGLGVFSAMIWAAALGQSAVASVFGIFGAFYISYSALVLGIVHNWWGLGNDAAAPVVTRTIATFLICWLAVFIMLTLATLRLPLGFTVLFLIVDVAVALVLAGVVQGSTTLLTGGGIAVFAFTLIGVYLFFDAMSAGTGGKPLPLGNPVLKG